MMQPKSRKQRVAECSSPFLCSERDTLCEYINNDDRVCSRSICLHDDAEWLARQEKIKRNLQENARREREEKAKEMQSPPAPIRRQTKTGVQLLEEQIKRREEKARSLYRANKPRAADSVMRDVMALQAKLRRMKGA